MSALPVAALERLSARILAGEIVFFIGAGFSLDSEGNSAERLITRLLARFDAMTVHSVNNLEGKIKETATALRETLILTFELSVENDKASKPTLLSYKNISKLAKKYYEINDWLCNAFGHLLDEFDSVEDIDKLSKDISELENEAFKLYNDAQEKKWQDNIELPPINFNELNKLDSQKRGKALFLDTMGFDNPAIMAGDPKLSELADVLSSYGSRLKPRHHVLARLAREGFCPTLITTNYDLLLEGAYRLAGFTDANSAATNSSMFAPTTFDSYSVVAGPTDFFKRGHGHQSALIVKIHGCVAKYRQCKEEHDENDKAPAWQSYLQSMVFTYREIQNWREDSWSRDYLCTLLRTRNIVFNGYSVIDPVLHDTIRSIYEEVGRQRKMAPVLTDNEEDERTELPLPAFYLSVADKKEFHGMEILRAASRAVGKDSPSLTENDNHLQFNLEKDDIAPFPLLDEQMRWLLHRTYRLRQAQVLKTNLRRIANMIMGHPCSQREVDAIVQNFDDLLVAETSNAETWSGEGKSRLDFNRIVNWTEHFHFKLLREFVLAESVQHQWGLSIQHQKLRQTPWYFPILDHPDWAAWSVVVELALRRMVAQWQKQGDQWQQTSSWLQVGQSHLPQIHFAKGNVAPTPSCLTIRLAVFERPGANGSRKGGFKKQLYWDLYANSVPWFKQGIREGRLDMAANNCAPDANVLWRWASGTESDQAFKLYLGENND